MFFVDFFIVAITALLSCTHCLQPITGC